MVKQVGLICVFGVAILGFSASRCTADEGQAHSTVLLWPQGAPLAQGDSTADKPRLTIYLPKKPGCRTGVIVIPGGGYAMLATDHEGKQPAQWLNNLGITAFVLEYRLGPKYHHPAELMDAQRAIRYVRSNASKFQIDSNRIGVWGFSAGGHLASTAGTHFDSGNPQSSDAIERESSRPDFMILVYPVISPLGNAAEWSFKQLLGDNPNPDVVRLLSNDLQVTPQTPPTFLVLANDDDAVSPENGVRFYLALLKAHVPTEMHIYLQGGHGFGLAPLDPVVGTWPLRLVDWLREMHFLN
jgi:acetyl esterase/lipase